LIVFKQHVAGVQNPGLRTLEDKDGPFRAVDGGHDADMGWIDRRSSAGSRNANREAGCGD
jgi:hypothetical protein